MDFLLLGGLGLMGHYLSNKRTDDNQHEIKILRQSNSYPIKSDKLPKPHGVNDIPKEKIQANNEQWNVSPLYDMDVYSNQFTMVGEQKEKPYNYQGIQGMSGKDSFHNNMVPFFKSDKSQNTNAQFKERSLETFTGSNNMDYTRKQEVENLFSPTKDLGNVYGALPESDSSRISVFKDSLTDKMNNITPVEKQYVGKGLNVGPDVKVKGGYHEMFRILPDNINSYKKQTFGGKVIPGKSLNANPDFTPDEVKKNKPDTFYTQCDYPTMPKSGVNASYNKPDIYIKDNNRSRCNEQSLQSLYGGAHIPSSQQITDIQYTLEKDDANCKQELSGPSYQTGGYKAGKYLVHETERENCGEVINAHLSKSANTVQSINNPNATLRDTTQYNVNGGGVLGTSYMNGYGHTTPGYKAPVTLREGSSTEYQGGAKYNISGESNRNYKASIPQREMTSTEYQGGAKYNISGETNRNYNASISQREMTSTEYQGIAGTTSSKSVMSYDSANNAESYHKREDTTVGYMPGPMKQNTMKDYDQLMRETEHKIDNNKLRNHNSKSISTIPTADDMGSIEVGPKLVQNPRLDFGLPSKILQDNPYINKPVKY